MTAREAARSAGKWTAFIVPTVACVSLLLTQGFCVVPWQQMSKAEAKQEHRMIEDRIDKHEDRITLQLDKLSADVHRILGAVESKRN
jgi:hypothetical protein